MQESRPAKLPEPGDPEVLYVMDLMGYVFRAYHALPPMSTSAGEPTHAVYGVTQMLLALVNQQRPRYLAVTLDPPGPSFRHELFDAYKANRKERPEDLRPQIERLEEVIEAYDIPCFMEPGFEADDVIATLVRQAREAGLRVVIVAADKDLLQLVGDGVIMYDTMRERIFGVAETQVKLGVPPTQVVDYLAMVGDSSDNVPGVKSVGPKTAAQLLADYPTLDEIYAHLDDIPRKGTRTKLAEQRAEAMLSRELVRLRDDAPVTLDVEAVRYGGASPARLRALFTKLEFHKLLPRIAAEPVELAEVTVVTELDGLRAHVAAARRAGRAAVYALVEGDDARRGPIAGVALAYEGEALYAPIGHLYLGAPSQPSREAVAEALRPLLTDPEVRLALGDSKRERLVWARLGVELANVRFDAMLASYVVDPERHAHGLEDVARSELRQELEGYDQLTDRKRGRRRALCDVEVERAAAYAGRRASVVLEMEPRIEPRLEGQGLTPLLDDVELPLAAELARMERRGIEVDTALLAKLSREYGDRIRSLEKRAFVLANHEFKINSPRALEAVLFDELGLPVVKRTKTARSTDHEVLEELARHHALPGVILEHRSLTKLRGTYLDALPQQVDPDTGRVHTSFNQAVAATGRMSSSDPNLQNIPIRTDAGRAIRDAFVAQDGWQLLSADYSQVELRVLAHLSHDPELIDAFRADEDVHVRTARAIFDVDHVTREMRGQAKTVNYAVIYGQTQFALARNLGIERDEAKRYIAAFFERYAGVARFMEEVVEEARTRGGVRTLLGRWRAIPDIRSKNRGLRAAAERMARNTPIQGTAADLIKVAMVRIAARLQAEERASRMLLTVHDELVLEVAPGEADAARAIVTSEMEGAYLLDVPLVVDVGLGRSWNDAH